MAFGTPIDVTSPAATDLVSAGDDKIRETREGFRERLDVDHDFGEDTAGDTINDDDTVGEVVGEHKKVTLQKQAADPAAGYFGDNALVMYAKDDASSKTRLFMKDQDGTVQQFTTTGNKLLGSAIEDGGVDTTQLAADAVTGDKIEDDAVDTEHLAAEAVDPAALKMSYKGSDATSVGIPIMAQGYYIGNGTNQTITAFSSNAIQIRHVIIAKSDEDEDPITEAILTEISVAGGGPGDATRAWRQHDGLLCDGSDDDDPNGVLRSNLVIGSGASSHQFTVTQGSVASANKWINSNTCQYMWIAYGMLREVTS